MGEHPPPPQDYASPQDRIAGQDWSGVAKTGLASMAPADKGWVLAVVVIIAILSAGDYFRSASRDEQFALSMGRMSDYLELVENDRRQDSMAKTEERKELIRVLETVTATVSRQANRAGRAILDEADP